MRLSAERHSPYYDAERVARSRVLLFGRVIERAVVVEAEEGGPMSPGWVDVILLDEYGRTRMAPNGEGWLMRRLVGTVRIDEAKR